MNTPKRRRRRGVILSRIGLKKLQDATNEAQMRENRGYRYTLEALGERTGLDPDTVLKVYTGKTGVDKQTLTRCFKAFSLKLESRDYHPLGFEEDSVEISYSCKSSSFQDWGNAPDISRFYGRQDELKILHHWIEESRCRIVALLGFRGTGTTSLGVRFAHQSKDSFDYIIWRSLSCACPIDDFLRNLLNCFAQERVESLPNDRLSLISRLLHYFRIYRCLLILDQDHSDLSLNSTCQNCKELGDFLQRVGETSHQSCLLFTGQIQLKALNFLEGESCPVRVMYLKGLQTQDIMSILKDKGVRVNSSGEDLHKIIDFYGGNPLILKFLSTTIKNIFDGVLEDFINNNSPIFGEIARLLDREFKELSEAERVILNQLTLNNKALSFPELREQLKSSLSPQVLLESMENLQERSLLEQSHGLFFLQPFIKVYLINQLVESPLPDFAPKILLNQPQLPFALALF